MILIYCPICRRVKIDATEARQMVSDYEAAEDIEREEFLKLIEETEDPDELDEISSSLELQTRQRIAVPEEFRGEAWVELNDQEWGAIATILQSSSLLYIVDNYSDYPEVCLECKRRAEMAILAELN